MSIDGGVRNTTMLLLVMCIPLLVASCQHTFGLGERITASKAVEEPESKAVSASDSGPAEKMGAKASTVAESELLVSVENETVSRDDAATVDRETDDPPNAQLAAISGTESAENDQESAGEETTVQPEEDSEEIVRCDATAEFEKWSVTLDDNIRKSVLREITAELEKATANFDRQQAQLERLQVETELYRMQIQHLQNRRQEWEPAE